MKPHSKPVKPSCSASSAATFRGPLQRRSAARWSASNTARSRTYDDDGLPFVVETAFAWRGEPQATRREDDEPRETIGTTKRIG